MKTLNYDYFYNSDKPSALDDWLAALRPLIEQRVDPQRHGDLPRWITALQELPAVTTDDVLLDGEHVSSLTASLPADVQRLIRESLLKLHPWRKGPFRLHDVTIDSEWRCNNKWSRLAPHIDLTDRTILDVGCGNGYYCMRMLGSGAKTVIGIDPNLLFGTQFLAVNHFIQQNRACVLPLGIDDLQDHPYPFDTVFSMGVLYHRRQPLEHLQALATLLKADGELILETLIIDGPTATDLVPEGRYANMRNVWSLPTVSLLKQQLISTGFYDINCVDVTQTPLTEQRTTDWMNFHSLEQALDPHNHDKTIEGHPAPLRAIVTAKRASTNADTNH